jgi:hypothetical protein
MRQVLELLSSLISHNPDKETTAFSIRTNIIQNIISILAHQASQPLVKPAFKSLECFLSKGTVSPQDLIKVYENVHTPNSFSGFGSDSLASWDSFISEMFDWMALQDVAPAAGKCLVTLFGQLRKTSSEYLTLLGDRTLLWQRWIRQGLSNNPDTLDNVKNYLFTPLFKLDRLGSLAFLEDLNRHRPMSFITGQEIDAQSLLQLAAMDVGKRAGLVGEASMYWFFQQNLRLS